jgi:hypothetical protein
MDGNLQSGKIRKLDKIQDELSYAVGEPNVSLRQLMNDRFILENTGFHTWESLLRAAPVKTETDLEKPDFNEFLRHHSRFADWEEMLIHASNEYALHYERDK